MRLCLLSTEVFAFGRYGGFGRATRTIGRAMAGLGIEVHVAVPRRPGQGALEPLDGMQVHGFDAARPDRIIGLLRAIDADVYHTQEPNIATWCAQRARPERGHIVTFRDTRTWRDWMVEFANHPDHPLRRLPRWAWFDSPPVRRAIRRADARYCCARFLQAKVTRKYGLAAPPAFLPTPMPVPDSVTKAERPLVCFNGRLDPIKKPGSFLALAAAFPQVEFAITGLGHAGDGGERLRQAAAGLDNLSFTGFLNQFEDDRLWRLLERTWILVNMAAREGLPNAFIEANAFGCAILSALDPDGFTSRAGHLVTDGDYAKGLACLLEDDRWRALGQHGREHVAREFAAPRAVELHLRAYRGLGVEAPAAAERQIA